MTDQQNHLAQLIEQRNNLTKELEKLDSQSTRTREIILKTQGAIEYLLALGVSPSESTEASAEEG